MLLRLNPALRYRYSQLRSSHHRQYNHHSVQPTHSASMAVASHRIQEAFERTKREFRGALRNPAIYADIQKATCIEDIYDAVEKLQEEQGKRGHLRHLRRIDPYLERVRQYSEVINTFVQAKSEILSLIWGPIALLLQIAKNLTKSFDAVISIMATIGESLPLFGAYTQLFSSSERILDVLCLFYKDILDFYSTALNFFSAKRKFPSLCCCKCS